MQTPGHGAETNGQLVQPVRAGSDINTAGFEIGNVGSGHFLIANKFCFARPHLMLLTCDGYQRQYEPLDEADLEASWKLLNTIGDGYVAFYNCGKIGGCSRLHKHMQLMPMPTSSFASFLDSKGGVEPIVPFQWFFHRFGSQPVTPAVLTNIYTELLQKATTAWEECPGHTNDDSSEASCPHNVILTSRWIMVIPRRRAAVNKEAGVNALGMIGVVAVSTTSEIENWVQLGLGQSLKELGVPN